MLLPVAASTMAFWILGRLRYVLITLAIALLVAAFPAPVVYWLGQWESLAPSLATAGVSRDSPSAALTTGVS
jgi:membrane associated rhomboid family serine protease